MAEAVRKRSRKKDNLILMKTKAVQPAYYGIQDVMTMQGCSERKAQAIVKSLNDELEGKGYLRWPKGKISKNYYHERFGD